MFTIFDKQNKIDMKNNKSKVIVFAATYAIYLLSIVFTINTTYWWVLEFALMGIICNTIVLLSGIKD